ncbi:Crp/Fnr family transcriptional regulator [Clostridium chrysemydis]|uniref:Crp/Fnr family transcriptional regulator n=1 Tax=Clostridium chrysemydis TaxID=2665504 RepID=UPI00188331DA|nr:Crp/Fnr family transcriptional regulator [Clostridium chrysemydis]
MIKLSVINNIETFSSLSDKTKEYICNFGELLNLKRDEHVFRDKDYVDYLYILVEGKVALYKLNEHAHKKIVFILGHGEILNEVILDDLPESINCEVFEKSKIISIKKDKLKEIMEEDFEFSMMIINSLSRKTRRLYRQIKNTTPVKVEKKLAAKIWKLGKDYGVETEEGLKINLKLSITYLSDMFGMPRETISRAFKILVQKNLIKKEKSFIYIIDKEALSIYFKSL